MNQTPLASIIIPTWNGIEYIEDCLDSLLAQDYPEFEVIIVDNASSDGTPEWVAEHFPTVMLIRNERNLGFAGGVNVGLRAARGDVLILFNQDAAAKSGWLRAMVTGLMASPDIGVAGCKIYRWNERTVSHAGIVFIDHGMNVAHRGEGEPDHGQYSKSIDVDAVTGAAMAIKRDVLNTIGLLDEDYFFYFEDIDLCMRAHKAGYRVVYLPDAVAQHRVAASLVSGSLQQCRYNHLSRLLFFLKYYDPDWFDNHFLSAEVARLRKESYLPLCLLNREVYLHTMVGLIQNVKPYQFAQERFSDQERRGIVEVLCLLAEATIEATETKPDQGFWVIGKETDNWWYVAERPFTSSVPLLGPLIARFREAWNNVAARWYVRGLLVQQLEINHRLVSIAETNNRLIQELNRDVLLLRKELTYLTAERNADEMGPVSQ
jgi:GT2 family glycosyltransferase